MKKNEKGQALLLILLSIGVILTVALSVVSKSVNDISVTQKDEQSLRAFSAAESGVEEALKSQISTLPTSTTSPQVQVGNTGNYIVSTNPFPENPGSYIYPTELLSGDVAMVWFASHNANNSLNCSVGNTCYTGTGINLCWGKIGVAAGSQPALVATIIYNDPASGNKLKYAIATLDPVSARSAQNHFTSAGITTNTATGACTIGNTNFANQKQLDFASLGISVPNVIQARQLKGLILRIFYNQDPTILGVNSIGGATLPLQGRKIESTGTAQEALRKVQVYALYPEIPNIFQSAIYSPPGVTK